MADPQRARRTFGPVVLLGLASAGLAAVAGTKPWVTGSGAESAPGVTTMAFGVVTSSPLSTALALVVLACWGVVMVSRGRVRQAVTWLSLLAALGCAATVATAPWTSPDQLVEQVRIRTGATLDDTSLTAWFWVAVIAAVLVSASSALAAHLVRHWPEMGTKYDAPTGGGAGTTPESEPVPTDNIDIWKALDEGRDPTA